MSLFLMTVLLSREAVSFVASPAVKKQSVGLARNDEDDEGWVRLTPDEARDMRAAIMDEKSGVAEFDWAYETRKVEPGNVLLGTSGIGLSQQHFHKCVILILDHGDEGTKGIVVNRPSSRSVNNFSLWYGGVVMEGGIFAERPDAFAAVSMECLTALDFGEDDGCYQFVRGVKRCSFPAARRLVDAGKATPDDFWVFCGYCGWAPGQLAGEIERKAWSVAAISGSALIDELVDHNALDDGINTWESLMKRIGKDVEGSRDAFADGMLRVWLNARLGTLPDREIDAASKQRRDDALRWLRGPPGEPPVARGALLAGTAVGSDFVVDRQYLHKSLLLVTGCSDDLVIAVTLNRPYTKKTVTLSVTEDVQIERHVAFGGEHWIRGQAPDAVWLTLGGPEGVARLAGPLAEKDGTAPKPAIIAPSDAALLLRSGHYADDFLAISGVSVFPIDEFKRLLGNKALTPLSNDLFPWDDIFAIHNQRRTSKTFSVGNGTSVWSKAIENAKISDFQADDDDVPPAPLADDALACFRDRYLN